MTVINLLDKKGNLLQGNIIVSNKNKLIDFRNKLLEETYEGKEANFEIIMPKRQFISFDDEVSEGISSINGLLVKNYNFTPDYFESDSCVYDYDREVIACRHLNTILLLSSLLDIVDRYYHTEIGVAFNKAGIFNVTSFDETWKQCRNRLLNPENISDLEAFRNAFVYGGITYDVHDSWLKEEIVKMNVLKTLDLELYDVATNTKVLGVQRVLRPFK